MSDVRFYTYTIDEPISRIAERIAGVEASSDADLRALGAFFLAPFAPFLPAAIGPRLRAAKPVSVSAFDRLLRHACCEEVAWSESIKDASVITRLDTLYRSDPFNTTQLIGSIYYALSQPPRQELTSTVTEGPTQLLKKFEVFGRIFIAYTPHFSKASARFDVPLNYALLSLVLLELYERDQGLRYLNAALKLNDLLIAIEDELESLSDLAAACAALCRGKSLVEKLYGSREFRLPVHQ